MVTSLWLVLKIIDIVFNTTIPSDVVNISGSKGILSACLRKHPHC